MQIIVKGGVVIATHDNGVITDPVAAYGAGATAQTLKTGDPVPALMSEASLPGPRQVTGSQLLSAMTDDQAKAWQATVDAGTPAVRAYWASAYRDMLPENSPKLVKVAGRAKVDLGKIYDAALGVSG